MKASRFAAKSAAALLTLLMLAVPAAFAAADDTTVPPPAKELTSQLTVTASSAQELSWAALDNSRSTKAALPAGETVTITSEEPMERIYLIWDRTPEHWSITCDGEVLDQTERSFLHDLVELPRPATEVTITAEGENGMLCDVYAFAEGELPDWVQVWQPPCERADLLVFPTHADDELLFFGGTMPYYAAEKDMRVQVVYLTNHYGEPYRPHELLNGLWTVGIRAYPVMGPFPDYYSESLDHAKSMYGEDEVLGFQTEMLRRFRPYVVIGHDLGGEYGHGVHQLNAWGLQTIADKTGDPTWFPESAEKYGVWELPKLYLHLYPENQIVMDWDVPLSAFDGKTAYEVACWDA